MLNEAEVRVQLAESEAKLDQLRHDIEHVSQASAIPHGMIEDFNYYYGRIDAFKLVLGIR